MITKEKLQKHIDKLPDEISIDELIDKLEKRIEESKQDKVTSDEDFEKEMQEWFK